MTIEHVVLNKDFATTLIKEGLELKGIRPNNKKCCESQLVFLFDVEKVNEEIFDNRMN